MKFSFKIQQYQTDAVDAVARVFQGQPYNAGVSYLRDMGSLSAQPQQLSLVSSGDDATQVELLDLINDSGFKNEALQLTDQELLQNIRALQAEANIHQSDKLVAPLGRCSLDIEMETGTGKTYVYIKTMFELNKRYGWSKFIVVVPSIAIREGVKKSFEITADHFMECYGKKARFFMAQRKRAWNGSLRKIWMVQRKSLSMQNCRKASIFRPRLDTTPRTGQSCSMRAR